MAERLTVPAANGAGVGIQFNPDFVPRVVVDVAVSQYHYRQEQNRVCERSGYEEPFIGTGNAHH